MFTFKSGICSETKVPIRRCLRVDCKENSEVLKVMPIDMIIKKVSAACRQCGAERLDLFGSFATGTATPRSDIDFVVYGDVNSELLDQMVGEIDTLRKIDIFYYNEIKDEYLLEDIRNYGRKIY